MSRITCKWIHAETASDMGGSGSGGGGCCDENDPSCLKEALEALGANVPTPTPPVPTPPRHSECRKLGKLAADMAQATMCRLVVAFPGDGKDPSQFRSCRDVVLRVCKAELPGKVDQSCRLRYSPQEIRSACKEKVNLLLGDDELALYDSKDYEAGPYDEEKFD